MASISIYNSDESPVSEVKLKTVQKILGEYRQIDLGRDIIDLKDPSPDISPNSRRLKQLFSNLDEETAILILDQILHPKVRDYLFSFLSDQVLMEFVRSGKYKYTDVYSAFDNPFQVIPLICGDPNAEFFFSKVMLEKGPDTYSEEYYLSYLLQDLSLVIKMVLLHFVTDEDYIFQVLFTENDPNLLYHYLDEIRSPRLLRFLYTQFKDPAVRSQIRIHLDRVSN